jgi:TonB-linked SusC/RagA family outer membrane protein
MTNRVIPVVTLIAALSAARAEAQAKEYPGASAGMLGFAVAGAATSRLAEISVLGATVSEALMLLSERARVPVAFSASLLPASTHRVDCPCETVTVAEALDHLLDGTNLDYREVHGQIVIFPRLAPVGSVEPVAPVPPALPVRLVGMELRSLGAENAELVAQWLALAQQATTIRGRVFEAGSGRALSPATVNITGTRLQAVTDPTGAYVLQNVPAGNQRVLARMLGYAPLERMVAVAPGATVQADFGLSFAAITLEQVVVTGTAGNQQRGAQPALVASIDVSDITTKAPVLTVNDVLFAKTPGLTLTQSSGTSGTNTRIDVRGQASISLSNYPLVFIDGVRATAGSRGIATAPGGTTGGAGGQQFNALNDLNPDDIESIEIVKGPAAATLYGADASAGVIQILTKKGRVGAQRMNHRLSLEYHTIDPNFTPYTNYGTCTAALVTPTSTNPLCRGQTAGTIVSDNVLVREGAFTNGKAGSLRYTADGGGPGYGYFLSFSALEEVGTSAVSELHHRTGRVNFNWFASSKLNVDISAGLVRVADKLPQGDQSSYGYLVGGDFGSPLTVRDSADGTLSGGWFNNNVAPEGIAAIKTEDVTMRYTPSAQLRYSPAAWFTNRLTLGADLVRTTASQMYPKNTNNWYSTLLNTGSVAVTEANTTLYTVDYLGNINRRFGEGDWISTNLSLGSQWIHTVSTSVGATGQGLLTNANYVVSGATTTTASEGYAETKSLGLIGQLQVGFHDRLNVQVGARVDRNSAFGSQVGWFVLPKVGASYVLSQESFWPLSSLVSTFRLRAAYGTTGRSPSGPAALQTYARTNYITDAGVVQPGVSPGSPGNPDLKPEHGSELEAGFDAGLWNDRVGLELTYFDKRSKDLLLALPLAPSSGFTTSPLVNIGEVSNKGLEIALRTRPVDGRNLTWDADLNLSTLANEIVSMGDVTPYVSASNQCFKPGVQVAAWCVPRVLSVDTVAGTAVVSDTAEVVGGQLPKYTASASTTLTLFQKLRVYAQFYGKWGYKVYNLTKDFRDRALANSAERVLPADQGGYSTYERIRHLGPFLGEQSGLPVGAALVRDPYIVDGDFVRFRELSLTWSMPESWSRRLALAGASFSVGASNLALWTNYDGFDPEVIGSVDTATPFLADIFTLPQTRRMFARLNLQF